LFDLLDITGPWNCRCVNFWSSYQTETYLKKLKPKNLT
jgi:hypothetical protein